MKDPGNDPILKTVQIIQLLEKGKVSKTSQNTKAVGLPQILTPQFIVGKAEDNPPIKVPAARSKS